MKKIFTLCLVVSAGLLFAITSAMAVPDNYEGEVFSDVPVYSLVGFGWAGDDESNVDFWSFYAETGDNVVITGARQDDPLDLALSLYEGTTEDLTGFDNRGSFGGMTYLTYADDTIDHPGPYGDPEVTYNILNSGFYTVAIGGYSGNSNEYHYELTVAGNSAGPVAPEPVSSVLFVIGGTTLVFRRFMKKKNC